MPNTRRATQRRPARAADPRHCAGRPYYWTLEQLYGLVIAHSVGPGPVTEEEEARVLSRGCVALITSLIVSMLATAGAGAHEGIETSAGHEAEDAVMHPPAQEQALDNHTRTATASAATAAALAVAAGPQDVGQWGPVEDW